MDMRRVLAEVNRASGTFALVEAQPTFGGEVCAKAALQTSCGNVYIVRVEFAGYPSRMPMAYVTKPTLRPDRPHKYNDGSLCFMHPRAWNPGTHDLTFVLGRVAKWLNKYEVWRVTGRWPGAQFRH